MRFLSLAICFLCLSCKNNIVFESANPLQKERILLSSKKSPVDLLLVVDSSQSMYHHLDKLGRSLSYLLSVLSDYDWQLAFTTVDHGDHENPKDLLQAHWKNNLYSQNFGFGRLMPLDDGVQILQNRILTKNQTQYSNIFYHTLSHASQIDCHRPPYCAHRLEQPLRALKSALERVALDNQDFFRPQADLVTLIITNEDERSEDFERGTQAEDVLQTFYHLFGNSKKFINYNILVQDEECLAQEKSLGGTQFGRASLGIRVAELAYLTGGINIDICSDDYGRPLESISHHIKKSLETSLILKKEPVKGSVQIDFNGHPEVSWSLLGRKILFHEPHQIQGEILIFYETID